MRHLAQFLDALFADQREHDAPASPQWGRFVGVALLLAVIIAIRRSDVTPTTSATWVEEHAVFFLRRYLDTGAELDLYALMGVIAGRLAPVAGRGREKDYRDYDRLPGFRALADFVEQAAATPADE